MDMGFRDRHDGLGGRMSWIDQVSRRSPTWLLLGAVAGVSLFVFACGGGGANAPGNGASSGDTTSAQGDELPTIELPSLWDSSSAASLETLIGSADVVFRGNVVALKGQRAALAQPADPSAPAPRWADLPVSQFEVRVESAVSGSLTAGTLMTFEQAGGVQTRADGSRVRIMLEGDQAVQVGATYLFFGSVREDGIIEAPPFGRMQVRADGSLAAEARWADVGALKQLSSMSVGDAEREISAAAVE